MALYTTLTCVTYFNLRSALVQALCCIPFAPLTPPPPPASLPLPLPHGSFVRGIQVAFHTLEGEGGMEMVWGGRVV